MKNVLRFIGVIAIIVSLSNVIVLALKGYNENIVLIGASVFITVVGFVLLIAADNMQIRLTDKQIADAITSLERQSLRDKMAHWEMNSMKKRLSVYLEEGINQMVRDIPRHIY
jgi:signal transduction histidine kinase